GLSWFAPLGLNSSQRRESGFFPVRQGHEFVHDLLQSLQSPFLIGCSDDFLATLQVHTVCFADFRDFFSQLSNAFFDGLGHKHRLAEHFTPWSSCFSTVTANRLLPTPGGRYI